MLDQISAAAAQRPPWRVLVVDDEKDVFTSTQVALRQFSLDGRAVTLTYADSAGAAYALLSADPDFALVLLDVVMESDSAGLDLVRRIRNELQMPKVRIVLRTGQAGKAPEERVVREFEINDYLEKTRGDRTRIRTIVATSLRAWAMLDELERRRAAMATLARATRALIGHAPLEETAEAGLGVVVDLVDPDGAALRSGFCLVAHEGQSEILAATGSFAAVRGEGIAGLVRRLGPDDMQRLEDGLRESGVFVAQSGVWVAIHRTDGRALLFYASGRTPEPSIEREILDTVAGTLGRAAEQADPA